MANLYKISLIFAFIVLAACTDYGDVVDEKYEELIASQQVVDTLACDLKSEGMVVPTADGGNRKCEGGEWILIKEDVSSSSEKRHSSSSVVKSSSSTIPSTEILVSSSIVSSDNEESSSSSVQVLSSSSVVKSSSSVEASTEKPVSSSILSSGNEESSCSSVQESSSSSVVKSSSSVGPSMEKPVSSSNVNSSNEESSSSGVQELSSSSVVKSSSSTIPSTEMPISSSMINYGNEESSSSCVQELSSSSTITQLYLCEDGTYVVNEENCIKTESSSSSSTILSSSSTTPVQSSSSYSSSSMGYRDESVYDRINHLLTDKRDGKTYKTTTIDGIVWMAENLNYDYNHGSARSFCYGDLESNCDTYGRLYDWAAAIDSAGIFSSVTKECGNGVKCNENGSKIYRGTCPKGWHVPTNDDQILLYTSAKTNKYVNAQDALKSIELWNPKGQDLRGFSALPSGYRNINGVYEGLGKETYLWTFASGGYDYYEQSFTDAFTISLSEVDQFNTPLATSNAVSLRCVMDIVSEQGSFIDSRDGREYKTVTIGDQTWMAENLAYNCEQDPIGSACYQGSLDSCAKYGRLYTLQRAYSCPVENGYVNTCPEGWKLPSKQDWDELVNVLGGVLEANTKLVAKTGWNDGSNGEDTYGFAVLPAGYQQSDYISAKCDGCAVFWTSSYDESSGTYDSKNWTIRFNYKDERNPPRVYPFSMHPKYALSVRCMQDLNLAGSDYDTAANTLTDLRDMDDQP